MEGRQQTSLELLLHVRRLREREEKEKGKWVRTTRTLVKRRRMKRYGALSLQDDTTTIPFDYDKILKPIVKLRTTSIDFEILTNTTSHCAISPPPTMLPSFLFQSAIQSVYYSLPSNHDNNSPSFEAGRGAAIVEAAIMKVKTTIKRETELMILNIV